MDSTCLAHIDVSNIDVNHRLVQVLQHSLRMVKLLLLCLHTWKVLTWNPSLRLPKIVSAPRTFLRTLLRLRTSLPWLLIFIVLRKEYHLGLNLIVLDLSIIDLSILDWSILHFTSSPLILISIGIPYHDILDLLVQIAGIPLRR